ncbi:hypothetical protein O6H91_21G065400 [Diphasiastrum complanatum]|uniref:Uncharacterized protein n=1 Tax=Diphasiastrum complanatum TaxID=34168 RepID=A0ACC2ALL0_DIPCM|nr:hypothetical protein O6H91_Y143200 [Diphasiastrum complanatum]KAJ7518356.1 hypothetical protein O6H91_21G065400 [Diphasiastrum complanatum]
MGERRVGVAMDFSPSSKYALNWAIDNIAREGDSLFVVMVARKNPEVEDAHLWMDSGSPLIPLCELDEASLMKKYGVTPDAEVLSALDLAAREKKLVVVGKVYYGDPRDKICDAVVEIPLDCVIMGSRGLGTLKRALLGSVSNYVVNNAPCPVTVVKLLGGSGSNRGKK